ncbi:hypothetical protein SCP_1002330 [Sparassis crispa]|uniref:Uncharacterized protein n=1 Tax=Sparassis crispa TaxID=139825 RepID=A0A401GXQ6_9APHY|nr:hypothetical protein SCP_1002330 [Sparassis crispa]GBE86987.1 hypothetical protein SCP_1002330 [Sparassis crispa]
MSASSNPERDEHVRTLRQALYSIIAPKRPYYHRSSSSASGTVSPTPTPVSGAHTDHPATPHHQQYHPSNAGSPVPNAHADTPPLQHSPLAPAPPVSPGTVAVPIPHDAPHTRPDFIGTLQSKSAWDALIHGSWV